MPSVRRLRIVDTLSMASLRAEAPSGVRRKAPRLSRASHARACRPSNHAAELGGRVLEERVERLSELRVPHSTAAGGVEDLPLSAVNPSLAQRVVEARFDEAIALEPPSDGWSWSAMPIRWLMTCTCQLAWSMLAGVDATLQRIERALVVIRRRQTRRVIAGTIATSAYEVLDAVEAAEEAGGPPTVTEIAAALHLDQPRTSRLVATTVAAGWVRRQAHPTDGRRSCLERTREGRRVTAAVHRQRQTTFAAAMTGWSAAERATFARLLSRFVEALDAPATQL
jgi:DNA-binding MarR family transcriptional regulator